MVLASSLDNLANDLPLTSAFVPFVDQATRYLSGVERLSGARLVDDFVSLREVTSQAQTGGVDVVGPNGARPMTLAEAATARTLKLSSSGFYQIHLSTARDGLIGVNPDVRESDLELLPPEVQHLWSGSSDATSETQPSPSAGPALVRVSLWWYAMLAVLAVALAESVVAGEYLGTQREEA